MVHIVKFSLSVNLLDLFFNLAQFLPVPTSPWVRVVIPPISPSKINCIDPLQLDSVLFGWITQTYFPRLAIFQATTFLNRSPPTFLGAHNLSQVTKLDLWVKYCPLHKNAWQILLISCNTFLGRMNTWSQYWCRLSRIEFLSWVLAVYEKFLKLQINSRDDDSAQDRGRMELRGSSELEGVG